MASSMTTDPQDELFDVLTPTGEPTGRVAPRGVVHRVGLWHAAFHLWIIWRDEDGTVVLLQRRSRTKDTMPGRIDVSVGGHFRHGEYHRQYLRQGKAVTPILREVHEELGLVACTTNVHWIGTRWSEHRETGKWDREIQELFLWVLPAAPEMLWPDVQEVEQVVVVPLSSLAELLSGTVAGISARILWDASSGSTQGRETWITLANLVPGRQAYWRAVVPQLEAAAGGQLPSALVFRDDGPEETS
ncbi:NUDIX domain-containing protein [Thermomicrobium sp. CFH 73360]|uniref:NUDIX hydrolase n=1 Tax=Thermomicrobium sp. CFH 73360 TaxID=2951987 RepID=UPI0020772659|nr:NUDIX domain-containing protein [Thermomicrobium sp. CFH 73360]MCM8747251.1 NUDIX domain-containing protein [Thermomicrobium sp. CFH 73360]